MADISGVDFLLEHTTKKMFGEWEMLFCEPMKWHVVALSPLPNILFQPFHFQE